MLWQNHNAIIVGKHQISAAEICPSLVDSHNITVVRRLSGGGAVYHDLGNINFTFITDNTSDDDMDFTVFCKPIKEALNSFCVPALISGRNDMTIEGKKISGNAQYSKHNRTMHHGTLLYDSDLDLLSRVLSANAKIESAAIKSVRSRVTNIRPYMQTDMATGEFLSALKKYLIAAFDMEEYPLKADDLTAVEVLCEQVYSQWSWNYGASPPYNVRKSRRIEGCGTVEVLLDVEKEGVLSNIAFYGDFFGKDDTTELAALLTGHRLERKEISAVLQGVNVSRYFHNMNNEALLSLLLE